MKFDVPSQVINKLFDNGYEDQILDIVQEFENDDNREVSDIPLSPINMQDSGESIFISLSVYEEYKKMINIIKNPETSQEIPYILLGNRRIINNKQVIIIEDIKYCNSSKLDDLHVSIDKEQFKQLLLNSNYSIISIGHTHGNVAENKKNSSLVRHISEQTKEKYGLRDIGLNISVSDVWQHEAFKYISSQINNKEVLQTIIMYNGDIIIMSSDGISKSNNVQSILPSRDIVSLSTAISSQKSNSQSM